MTKCKNRAKAFPKSKSGQNRPPPSPKHAKAALTNPPTPEDGQFYKQKSFKALRKQWYKRLKDEGFNDIEHTMESGETGHLSTDYALGAIRARYTPEAAEFWRRVQIFNQHYSWKRYKGPIAPAMASYIWRSWSKLDNFQDVVNELKKPSAPRQRFRNGPICAPPSIFWVHTKFKQELEPEFKRWCREEGAEFLKVDWVLNSP